MDDEYNYCDIINKVEPRIKKLMDNHNTGGHDYDHCVAVKNHCIKALELEPDLNKTKKLQIELAAFLHEVDDEKIFTTKNYQNARDILNESIISTNIKDKNLFIQEIIDMIDLVSCSKNGDSDPMLPYMVIPRDCDRLEAIGQIGIERCRSYNDSIGRPLHTTKTARVYTLEQLWEIATEERFSKYQGKSDNMIDHYYDKLLHIGKPGKLKSKNKYILQEAKQREDIMIEYILNYWKENK